MILSMENASNIVQFSVDLFKDRTRHNLRLVLERLSNHVGMNGFTWWVGSYDNFEQIDTRPKRWMKYYRDNDLILIDPIVRLASLKATPFVWSQELKKLKLTVPASRCMANAADYGVKDGLHFPVGTVDGRMGNLSFFSNSTEKTLAAWQQHSGILFYNAITCMRFSLEIGMAEHSQPVKLSPGEIDAVVALMNNNTRQEAANKLGVKKSTFDDRVTNILRKLEVDNLVSAVSKIRGRDLLPYKQPPI